MTKPKLNLDFTSQPIFYNQPENAAYAKVFVGLMILTGVRRLFNKKDVYEFIKRIQLLLPELEIIDNFFTNDSLFSFKFKLLTYHVTFDNLEELIGIEALNKNENHEPFLEWKNNINQHKKVYQQLIKIEPFWGLKLIDKITDVKKKETFNNKKTPIVINYTPTQLKQAIFLAEVVTKSVSQKLFNRINKEHPLKTKRLKLRQAPFKEPIFVFSSLETTIKNKLVNHLLPGFSDLERFAKEKFYTNKIYLAWLWSNGFVIKITEDIYEVDERIKNFDLSEFITLYTVEDEDDDNDLDTHEDLIKWIYDNDNFSEIEPLLYNPEIAKLSERPWEKITILRKLHFK